MRRLLVYVAGPFTPPAGTPAHDITRAVQVNVDGAVARGLYVLSLGHFPVVPHLNHYLHVMAEDEILPEVFYMWDLALLRRCDMVWAQGVEKSAGVAMEVAAARAAGIDVVCGGYADVTHAIARLEREEPVDRTP